MSHVLGLVYAVDSDKHTAYRNPSPIEFSNSFGAFRLADGRLAVQPQDRFETVDEARRVIEPFLRAWELQTALREHLLGTIRFRFELAELNSERETPGSILIAGACADSVAIAVTSSADVIKSQYPDPPSPHFALSIELEIAARRWWGYRAGREPLLSAAYAILTLIELGGARRKDAADGLAVDKSVLDTLGRLSSESGDGDQARKISDIAKLRALSDKERAWLEDAIPKLLLRLGERSVAHGLPRITMADLPPL